VRKIGVVTVGRSDFGIYRPVLRAIDLEPQLQLSLIVSGAHLVPTFGDSVREISRCGFAVQDHVDMLLSADTPEAISKSMGVGILGFSQVYQRNRPDILLVLGDRFEMLAAVVAAVPFKIPIAHIHGGELTLGAIDDAFRHAITKCSHLHFASTREHAQRIIQLGEQPHRVFVSGAPSLDNLNDVSLLSKEVLEDRFEMPLPKPPIVVTFHPVTLQYEQAELQIRELISALARFDNPIVITKPNADTSGQIITRNLEAFARQRADVRIVDNLGTQGYFSLMSQSAVMVGNSSSGIIEAASFSLPVVNIGIRQEGRPRSANVIDVDNNCGQIAAALKVALSDDFKSGLHGLENIYGTGNAAECIVRELKHTHLGESLVLKRFHDFGQRISAAEVAA